MLSSVVSTCVTRWAFKRSCFLINVSTSTSVPFPSLAVSRLPRKDIGFEVFFFLRLFNSLLQTCSPITLLGYEPIKVSQENFIVISNKYANFESFKAEALEHIKAFAGLFEIKNFNRIGLRYINHIDLPGNDVINRLQEMVRAPIDFARFNAESIEQFLTEFRLKMEEDRLTVRGALLAVP